MKSLRRHGAVIALLLLTGLVSLAAACFCRALGNLWEAALLSFLAAIVPVLAISHCAKRPLRRVVRALRAVAESYRHGDFSVSLPSSPGSDLDDLVAAHRDLGRALREQHARLMQRELLLDTVMQNSPVALTLVDSRQRVVYSNLAARHLLNDGRSIDDVDFRELLTNCPPPLKTALEGTGDSLVSVEADGTEEIYNISQRSLRLHGRPHTLFLLKRVTRELRRQEVIAWKRLIRVLSHEINNSLGPISSLAHTGAEMMLRNKYDKLTNVFDSIRERAQHLGEFIGGYAAFARVPMPQPQTVAWREFIGHLALHCRFQPPQAYPSAPGRFDPVQMSQALINLLKNAAESGSDPQAIELSIEEVGPSIVIMVLDRGCGMSAAVLANALLPFYSTKRSGTGIGLPLTREIVELHGGTLSLSNREGGGSCVRVMLPAAPGTQATGGTPADA